MSSSYNAVRQLLERKNVAEKCDFCGEALQQLHEHLIDPESRNMICACRACALLFSSQGQTKYRRLQHKIFELANFRITDVQWENLGLPINLAFFFNSSVHNEVMAFYPSPAGPIESRLDLSAWQDIAQVNPILGSMQPDIEALLINRLGNDYRYFIAPIDECYRLVGLIRMHWRGLSGGKDVWNRIDSFFADLSKRAEKKEDSLA